MSISINIREPFKGSLTFTLHCDLAPIACKNFLALAGSGFYDGTHFNRNIKGFIIQGGKHKKGSGMPTNGTSIYDGKPFADEIHPSAVLSHS